MGPGISAGEDLFADGMAPGLKAARSRSRLRHGTLEPVASMSRERHKRRTREAESTESTGRTLVTSSGMRVCEAQGRNDP